MERTKNAVIFHGAGETPNSIWIPYMREGLQEKGYFVAVPEFSSTERPELSKWLPKALELSYTDTAVLIAHFGWKRVGTQRFRKIKGSNHKTSELDEFWFDMTGIKSAVM